MSFVTSPDFPNGTTEVESGLYPLGSCTMKYNPKVNEDIAKMSGFSNIHPYTPEDLSQGILQLMYELQRFLAEITGMDDVTLQPAAGAHGELTGLMMVRQCLEGSRREKKEGVGPGHGPRD